MELDKGKRKAVDISDSLISGQDDAESRKKKKKTKLNSHGNLSAASASASGSSATVIPGPQSSVSTVINETSSGFSFQSGCQWSSVNYSCAYDAAYMSLYSIYNILSPEQQKNIRKGLNKYGMLGNSLEFLSQPGLQTPERFNFFRDQFQDYLSGQEPRDFPRYGPHGASVVLIFEKIFPRDSTRQVEMYGFCDCGHEQARLGFEDILPTIATSFDAERYKDGGSSNEIALAEHLQLLVNDIEEWYSNDVRYCQCGLPFSKLSTLFIIAPPILYFELRNDISESAIKILPSLAIEIPSTTGKVKYKLVSIVYLGRFHFTCRFIVGRNVWTYDGCLAHGCPTLESRDLPINNLCSLL